jgi:hypothetical protein
MSTEIRDTHISPTIVPIDHETSAMLDYAESAPAKIKIENGRDEIRRGEGILPTPDYFSDLNRRIAQRAKSGRSQHSA